MNTANIVVKIHGNIREDRGYLKSIVERDFYGLRDINISSDKVVIDLGAHIGMFSIYANKLFGCEVRAYEPERNNYQRLIDNRHINKSARLFTLNSAIWDYKGELAICLDPSKRSFDAHTLFIQKEWNDGGLVKTVSPKAIFSGINTGIGYLKSNCQGGEYYLLKYFEENPEILNKIDRMFIEIHPHLIPKDKWIETVELVKWFKVVYKNPCRIQLAGVAKEKYGNTDTEVDTF